MRSLKKHSWLSISVLVLSVGSYGLVLSKYVWNRSTDIGIGYDGLFLILIGVLVGTVGVMYMTRERFMFYLSLGVNVMTLFVFHYYFGSRSGSWMNLAYILMFHIAVYERFPLNLVECLVFTVFSGFALIGVSRVSAGRGTPVIGTFQLIDYLIHGTLLSFAVCLMTKYREMLIPMQRNISRLNEAVIEVTKANFRYQDYAQEAEERSRRMERLRLTRDIHDVVGYTMTNAMMMTEAAKLMALNEPEKIPDFMERARRSIENGMNQIRGVLHSLRSHEEQQEEGFAGIVKLVRLFEIATGVHVRLEFGTVVWEFDTEVGSILYHFIQEGLINAFRHGKASEIRILFNREDRGISISIRDNGVGADTIEEGIGLQGMRERLSTVGGRLDLSPLVDGFAVSAYVPLEETHLDDETEDTPAVGG
jgi:signal transduction histidine kinase